jgi:CO/xanthine dehydrogenase Mo-binding subunit
MDGSGTVRVVQTVGIEPAIRAVAPTLDVEQVPVIGPPTSADLRGAGWAEAAVVMAALDARRSGRVPEAVGQAPGEAEVRGPDGGQARAAVTVNGEGLPVAVAVELACGDPLDAVVLRSYATGAAHMALGWVCSEAIAVDDDGVPQDLTIRSFGVLRARDTPPIRVELTDTAGPAVNGSDAVFAAVAAATWIAQGLPPRWPTRRGRFS